MKGKRWVQPMDYVGESFSSSSLFYEGAGILAVAVLDRGGEGEIFLGQCMLTHGG